MEERWQLVRDALSDRFTMSELCARFGVSRLVGYKWLARYDAEGRRGLVDRSRAPQHCPHKISPQIADLVIAAREAHPFWGARKLLAIFQASGTLGCFAPAASASLGLTRRQLLAVAGAEVVRALVFVGVPALVLWLVWHPASPVLQVARAGLAAVPYAIMSWPRLELAAR